MHPAELKVRVHCLKILTRMLELTCIHRDGSREPVRLGAGFTLFCDGYTGRDQEAIRRHVRELESELGVPPPVSVPTCFPMVSRLALVDPGEIEVYGAETSGEAEPVLIRAGGKMRWLAVGSDHTDRGHERHGIAQSKNLCPKILSREVWAIDELEPVWDRLRLRSWSDGEAYQDARLATMLSREDLVRAVPSARLTADAVIMGGTVPTLAGFRFGRRFECALVDEAAPRELRVGYGVRVIEPIS
ncbi:MAG: DUF2848 domain-containing protein [Candidatus Dormibacteraceae bacterium]